jgi:hypothetical protein
MCKFLLFLLTIALPACNTMPTTSTMTPEQITAFSKDKSISAICTSVPTPWGVTNVKVLSVDQSVIHNGRVTIADGCGITMEDFKTAPSTVKEAPK